MAIGRHIELNLVNFSAKLDEQLQHLQCHGKKTANNGKLNSLN